MLSIPLFIRTFFKPLKNEYRGDLVGFSIGMGMVIKVALLFAGFFFFIVTILFEVLFYLFFLALPLIPVLVIFTNI